MNDILQIAGVVRESIVDGPGFRFVIFTQGCRHHCPGCHNPQTHPFEGGKAVNIEELLQQISQNPLLDGITLSGGEPFEQAEACAGLAQRVKELKLGVMTYTGYMYEELISGLQDNKDWGKLLEATDILVDGRFELARKNMLLKFRGSENQRIIDVKKSRVEKRVVIADV